VQKSVVSSVSFLSEEKESVVVVGPVELWMLRFKCKCIRQISQLEDLLTSCGFSPSSTESANGAD
jgi:hypothetical protein